MQQIVFILNALATHKETHMTELYEQGQRSRMTN